jgi:hypothetical protein
VGIVGMHFPRFAEFQLIPFLDMALAKKEERTLEWDDLSIGMGFDIVVFPDFLRGFQGRMSFGVDLRDPPGSAGDFASVEFEIVETLHF